MDIRVKPSALTDYMLLSQREAVMVLQHKPILLLASPVFNQLVRDTFVLYINPAASSATPRACSSAG
jgi:hypothetical protein